MKWLPIILSVLAALTVWLIGVVALTVHTAHTESTYRGWRRFGMINAKAVEEYNAKLPPRYRMDVLGQLRQAGNVRFWLRLLSKLSAWLFLLNAAVFYCVLRTYTRRNGHFRDQEEPT